jgi:hypothetical protein
MPLAKEEQILEEIGRRKTFLFRNQVWGAEWEYLVTGSPTPFRATFGRDKETWSA